MANNRMFLVHRPTGLAVYLGKRMASGWYMDDETRNNMGDRVVNLFDAIEPDHNAREGNQDDFMLVFDNFFESMVGTSKFAGYGEPREDGLLTILMK